MSMAPSRVEIRDHPLYNNRHSLHHYRDAIIEKLNHMRNLEASLVPYQNLVSLYKTGLLDTDDFELTAPRFPDGELYRNATKERLSKIHKLLRKADRDEVADWHFPDRGLNPAHFLASRATVEDARSWITGEPLQHLRFVKYSETAPKKRVEKASGPCSIEVKSGHYIFLIRGLVGDAPADSFIVINDDKGEPHEPFRNVEPGSVVYKSRLRTFLKTQSDKASYLSTVDNLLKRADLKELDSIALAAEGSTSIIDKVLRPFLLGSHKIHRVYLVTDKPRSWTKFSSAMGCEEPSLEQHVLKFLEEYRKMS